MILAKLNAKRLQKSGYQISTIMSKNEVFCWSVYLTPDFSFKELDVTGVESSDKTVSFFHIEHGNKKNKFCYYDFEDHGCSCDECLSLKQKNDLAVDCCVVKLNNKPFEEKFFDVIFSPNL